uniref:Derlin n=1 Tax=Trypanosoma vivax (strain Y486) TaxID=1055687 RepID=G0U8E3_TRYVY|nr:conserved hypothetical protein, fragment [Trypanosoma vivax Y486]
MAQSFETWFRSLGPVTRRILVASVAAFHFNLGQNIVEDVLGIVVGHMFFFVKDLLPLTNPIDPLRTPSWFLRHVLANDGAQRVGSIFPQSGTFVRQSSGRAAEERSRSHRWGPGRALGGM